MEPISGPVPRWQSTFGQNQAGLGPERTQSPPAWSGRMHVEAGLYETSNPALAALMQFFHSCPQWLLSNVVHRFIFKCGLVLAIAVQILS